MACLPADLQESVCLYSNKIPRQSTLKDKRVWLKVVVLVCFGFVFGLVWFLVYLFACFEALVQNSLGPILPRKNIWRSHGRKETDRQSD